MVDGAVRVRGAAGRLRPVGLASTLADVAGCDMGQREVGRGCGCGVPPGGCGRFGLASALGDVAGCDMGQLAERRVAAEPAVLAPTDWRTPARGRPTKLVANRISGPRGLDPLGRGREAAADTCGHRGQADAGVGCRREGAGRGPAEVGRLARPGVGRVARPVGEKVTLGCRFLASVASEPGRPSPGWRQGDAGLSVSRHCGQRARSAAAGLARR